MCFEGSSCIAGTVFNAVSGVMAGCSLFTKTRKDKVDEECGIEP